MSKPTTAATLPAVLSIAGSDSSGGAGIQADLKTMTMLGVFGMTAITALTAQNTTGVANIAEVTPEFLRAQIDAVFTDIRPAAVKIGMVSSVRLIEEIAAALQFYRATNIVLDPVMVATSGAKLLADDAIDTLTQKLLPLAAIITPNIPEAEILAAMHINNSAAMEEAAHRIASNFDGAVLIKGGHATETANDFLYFRDCGEWLTGRRIDNPNTHGTGCTLSSAVAAGLARGLSLPEAVKAGKRYVTGALAAMLDMGQGSGPLNHMFFLGDFFLGDAVPRPLQGEIISP